VRVRSLGLAALVAGLVLVPSGAGAQAPPEVQIQFSAYGPSQLDVLPGETVIWTNVSTRTHTVTSDDGLFDSGEVPGGARFQFQFTEPGTYHYHCTIHPSIVGEIDVRRVTLGTLPTAAVPVGAPVEFAGRAASVAQPVSVQRRLDGSAFTTIATATPAPDGSWRTTVKAAATGDYRAVSGTDASETRRLLVGIRRVLVHPTRSGLSVSVTPNAPYSRFLVEVYLRERFGWWPIASGQVNYISESDIRLRGPARVRIVLVDKDGWTPVATSRIVVLGKR
jgi:plastocyanin